MGVCFGFGWSLFSGGVRSLSVLGGLVVPRLAGALHFGRPRAGCHLNCLVAYAFSADTWFLEWVGRASLWFLLCFALRHSLFSVRYRGNGSVFLNTPMCMSIFT